MILSYSLIVLSKILILRVIFDSFPLRLVCPFFFGERSQDLNLVKVAFVLWLIAVKGVGLEYFFLDGGCSTFTKGTSLMVFRLEVLRVFF
jgi:hypothetical protein